MGLTVTDADTGEILHDTTAAELALADAIADALNERKQQIQDIANQIKSINDLSDLLRNHRPSESGGSGDLGRDLQTIVAGMQRYTKIDPNAALNGGSSLPQTTIDQWLNALSGASGDLSSQSQQYQGDTSTLLGRYNGAMDGASGIVKKEETLGDTVGGNVHN